MKDQRITMRFAYAYAAHHAHVVRRQEGGHVLYKRYGDNPLGWAWSRTKANHKSVNKGGFATAADAEADARAAIERYEREAAA